MTLRVEPTQGPGRQLFPTRIATTAKYSTGDWIVADVTDIQAHRDPELTAGPYNAAASNHSSTSLTVTIDTFEAFIEGAYVASDDSTVAEHDVTLDASTNGQEVFLGYDHTSTDAVIIGKASAFPSADNPRIKIWEYDTDGSGVTAARSHRPVGRRHNIFNRKYDSNLNGVVDDAASAQALEGRSATTVFRDVETASLPVTTLKNDDQAKVMEIIPEGKSLHLLRVSAVKADGNSETGLYARVHDPNNATTLYSNDQVRRLQGTVDNPIASIGSVTGGRAVQLQLDNQTGGERDASLRMTYFIE